MSTALDSQDLVAALKAVAEPTRLRILALLSVEELNVKDLTQILSQSQPRISRHLKLLVESGLIERFREGSWVYFHVSEYAAGGSLVRHILDRLASDDAVVARDHLRLQKLKMARASKAQSYFQKHAAEWDTIRTLHVPDGVVEEAMRTAIGEGPFSLLVDLGTGTGRVLELFSDMYEHGLGLDINQTMLSYARSKFAAAQLSHADVRHGDLYNINLGDGAADAVVMHQILHYLAEPQHALEEAARILKPGGRIVIVDFAPHDLEFLRTDHAHERLGFSESQMQNWIEAAGLSKLTSTTLQPANGGDGEELTVKVWTAERHFEDQQRNTPHLPNKIKRAATTEETVR